MMPGNLIFPESWNQLSWVPRLTFRYFLHSAVCKCDLCQLTGTGRYFEGNWTVYWRKLDGLFTETGWYGYGNWMVYWRKLDGQLTETGRSIDGKNGLLMEAVQQIFFILGAWKCDFAEFWNPRFRGHLAFFNSILFILEARKFDFCRVLKPRVQDYEASCEQILRILASWKCDFWRFVKPTFQGTSQWVEIFLIFEA